MAVATPKDLGQAAIGTSVSTLYTVPALTTTILKEINIVNTTTAAATVRVYRVPSAGTAGTGNAILYDWSIDAKGIFVNTYSTILTAGMTLQVSASAVGCTITTSGVEVA